MMFSVIIPVYNAEKTLKRCVDSLLVQNYQHAEIILVNDGSSDNSKAICEEYAEKFDNVKLISQENAGVSAARNAGLDAASGEYVLFVDSDDYVMPELFSGIDQILKTNHADLIQFSSCVDNGDTIHPNINQPLVVDSREKLVPHIVDAICRKSINGPCAKLYKKEFIEKHNIRFPVGVSVGEDRAFNIVYSFYIDSLIKSETIGYVINTENDDSLSRKRHDDLKHQFEIMELYIDNELSSAPIPDNEKEQYRQALNFGKCRGIYHDAKLMIQDRLGWFSRQKQLMKLCRKINKRHMKYPKARYCTLITLPVRLYFTPVIDLIALKLIRGATE